MEDLPNVWHRSQDWNLSKGYQESGCASFRCATGKRVQLGKKKGSGRSDKCPDKLPDLSEHSNCMTDFFKKNPEVYDTLKDKVRPG